MVKLKDGREIQYDLSLMTIGEWRETMQDTAGMKLEEVKAFVDKQDSIIAKVAGLKVEDLTTLPYTDYRKVCNGFVKATISYTEVDPETKN